MSYDFVRGKFVTTAKNFYFVEDKPLTMKIFVFKWFLPTLLKRDSGNGLRHRCFPVNIANFLRTVFLERCFCQKQRSKKTVLKKFAIFWIFLFFIFYFFILYFIFIFYFWILFRSSGLINSLSTFLLIERVVTRRLI